MLRHAPTQRHIRLIGLAALSVFFGAATPGYALADGSVPVQIDIPSIGAHAPVVPLGEDANGSMQAPDDPDTVGWFQPGTKVGVPGNVLLDGHVDWAGQLRAFGLLRQLQPGDTFQITSAEGDVLTYSVVWTQLYDADSAPVDQIFEQTSDEEVTLITCGGVFDHAIHMYLSRWVVRGIRTDNLQAGF